VYLVTLLYLYFMDLEILAPVRNNEIARVTNEIQTQQVSHITIADAKKYSELTVRVRSIYPWTKLNCNDMIGTVKNIDSKFLNMVCDMEENLMQLKFSLPDIENY
jgi:hypothetical protein